MDKLNEIDIWIGDNIKGKSWFYEDFPKLEPVWAQNWCFENEEDAVLFKVRWG